MPITPQDVRVMAVCGALILQAIAVWRVQHPEARSWQKWYSSS